MNAALRPPADALDSMSTGGKLKGLANLPEGQHIDVRKEIALVAGIGDRNVRTSQLC